MTPEQKAAFVIAQAACALAEIAAKQATNAADLAAGHPPTYTLSFLSVVDAYLIGHNAVIDFFRD